MPVRFATLRTWVSTAMAGMFQASASTTEAVLRPTPRNVTSSSMACGTTPPNVSTRSWDRAMIDLVFWRKNPVG